MARICLVSCARSKRPGKALARELYTSPLFRKASAFAAETCDKWYILSAKYGLVQPDAVIESYDQTLNEMSAQWRDRWAKDVFTHLSGEASKSDTITILAGRYYREKLVSMLRGAGFRIDVPMMGMSIGKQLRWLNAHLHHDARLAHVDRFYALLAGLKQGLGGMRIMKECTGQLGWPRRGVYFFFEPGENRRHKRGALRVVRVGTHAVSKESRSTLWGRLRTHRGAVDGTGNHRGSIFRLHVGKAWMSRAAVTTPVPSWGNGQSACKEIRELEEPLEREVSKYIGRMSLLWLAVDDEPGPASDRAYVERNSVGLLVGPQGAVDPPSESWLGNWSCHPSIRASGMWNVDYTKYTYDPRFLEIMARYVDITLGHSPPPKGSIAPHDWYLADKGKCGRGQQFLFQEGYL